MHDVKLPTDKSGIERGFDLQLGFRSDWKLPGTGVQPYAFAALNSAGKTSYAAAGLAWKFGRKLYIRPGVGLAVHNGSAAELQRRNKIGFGSRVLFEPELGIGTSLGDRASVEASWVHMSHAQLFSRENPGIDNLGVRLNWRL
jgi:hypothetical protein